jgi:glycosyltransferase involved in cell wall biosynthesis
MWEISILIKTFKRPETCQRLIDSIRNYYQDMPIIVLDDSEVATNYNNITKQLYSEFDVGVSAGRNKLVDSCPTKYCLILDDDCIFTDKTNILKAVNILETNDYDILELGEVESGNITGYRGKFKFEDDIVECISGEPLEFVNNIFVAKTESLKKNRWIDKLKMGEHFAFFFTHRGKFKIGYCKDITIDHKHVPSPDYDVYRNRSLDYVKEFMADNNIKKRIDLFGNVIEL